MNLLLNNSEKYLEKLKQEDLKLKWIKLKVFWKWRIKILLELLHNKLVNSHHIKTKLLKVFPSTVLLLQGNEQSNNNQIFRLKLKVIKLSKVRTDLENSIQMEIQKEKRIKNSSSKFI